jgi:peptide-methionine (S)-S-oxide reductase
MNERAIFAGGCFWGMEELFRRLKGVLSTQVGYTGGVLENPTYNDIKTGGTGHAEALEVVFDPQQISYQHLLQFFFMVHDPTTPNRQGNDKGSQYRSLICYVDESQKLEAQSVINAVNASGKWPGRVVTELAPLGKFYKAEDFHQKYLQKYPDGYTCHYIRPEWVL